jgi:multiple sugar transport system ATP-binding protein
MAKLALSHIHKRFGDVNALADVSFACDEGEFFCLLGASGAGKSTTINIISGIETPDSGHVVLDGKDITKDFPQTRNVATAFENYALYPHFTVFKNLMFPLEAPDRKRRFSPESREQRVRQVADLLGIGDLLDRYPRELSGGQKQRVALGRTLVRRPLVYLLDEPIAHLDAKLRHRMRSELKKIQKEMGITTLYCTPDQLEALSMADRIAVLNEGKIEQLGTPDDVYYRPANIYMATFIGDPPMNILEAELQAAGALIKHNGLGTLALAGGDRQMLEVKLGSTAVKIGIRPKDIQLRPAGSAEASMSGTVTLIDTLGQTSIVTFRAGTLELKLKISSDMLPHVGEDVGIVVDRDRFYFFDSMTGESIRSE